MTHCLFSMATVSNRKLLTSHDAQKSTLLLQEDLRMSQYVCTYVHVCVFMYVCTCMYMYNTMYVCINKLSFISL